MEMHNKLYSPHRTMMMIAVAILSMFISSVLCHPQCLDFYPPYELTTTSQPFCQEYQDFGCCTVARNDELRALYDELISQLSEQASTSCRNFLKDIMCLECSPYSVHLYDAETTHQKTPLPGLCGQYCSTLYRTCPELITLLTQDASILEAATQSEDDFCTAVQISDMDYCFPDILSNNFLNQWTQVSVSGLGEGCLCFEEFANGLRNPVLAVHANDSTHRLFIAEQIGIVHVFLRDGTRLNEPFLDVQSAVLTSSRRGDERGFLGLAFHPNFVNNSKLYVYYSTGSSSSQKIRISEFLIMSNDSNRVNASTERIIMDVDQPAANHNGGQILFDGDGYLLAFLGDGGYGGDPFGEFGNAQNLENILGTVIRIDVDRQEDDLPYGIPPDNPFVSYNNSVRRHEIYAYGTRNMWRCSIDRGDKDTGYGQGRIFCGDVGQSNYEEIDIIVKGGNYGWRGKEGFACYDSDICRNRENEVLPIHAYPHTVGKSVIGGYVYRGCQYPNLYGKYIFGDYVSGRVFYLMEDPDSNDWRNREFCIGNSTVCTGNMVGSFPKNILSFGEDEAGEVYILSTDNPRNNERGGKVFRIADPSKRGNPEECVRDVREVDVNGPTTPFEPTPSGSTNGMIPSSSAHHIAIVLAVCLYHLVSCLLIAMPTGQPHHHHRGIDGGRNFGPTSQNRSDVRGNARETGWRSTMTLTASPNLSSQQPCRRYSSTTAKSGSKSASTTCTESPPTSRRSAGGSASRSTADPVVAAARTSRLARLISSSATTSITGSASS